MILRPEDSSKVKNRSNSLWTHYF